MRLPKHFGGAAGAAWLAAGAAVTIGTMMLATMPSRPDDISVSGRPGVSEYFLPGSLPHIPPLTTGILASLLGPEAAARLLRDAGLGGRVATRPDRSRPPGENGSPPEDRPRLSEQLTSPPNVRVSMSVDKSSARQADLITYTITVTNLGRGIAHELRLESQVPPHTTFVSDDSCGGQPASVSVTTNPAEVLCYAARVDDPTERGQGQPYAVGRAALRPGERFTRIFTVSVDPETPTGTVLRNRATVSGPGLPTRTSAEVATIVT